MKSKLDKLSKVAMKKLNVGTYVNSRVNSRGYFDIFKRYDSILNHFGNNGHFGTHRNI